jgi:hypothetical protein
LKNRKSRKPLKSIRRKAQKFPRRLFLAGGGLLAGIVGAGWFSVKHLFENNLPAAGEGDLPRRGEARPVLSPDQFQGSVRRAYQAAQRIPGLIDKLFSYCYCDRTFGHKSLLSCYATTHAAG